jgi:hypothetical protein
VAAFGELLPHVVLTGGDPLKRKDLFELIAAARELGLAAARLPRCWYEHCSRAILDQKLSSAYTAQPHQSIIRDLRSDTPVKIWIRKLPPDSLEGYDLRSYQFRAGHTCDVGRRLGEVLIVSGYAMPEMRCGDRDAAEAPPHLRRKTDRLSLELAADAHRRKGRRQ